MEPKRTYLLPPEIDACDYQRRNFEKRFRRMTLEDKKRAMLLRAELDAAAARLGGLWRCWQLHCLGLFFDESDGAPTVRVAGYGGVVFRPRDWNPPPGACAQAYRAGLAFWDECLPKDEAGECP